MLMPRKHIRMAESILGLSAVLLPHLRRHRTVDQLWSDYLPTNNSQAFPAYHSFDNFLLALDYLYMTGLIEIDEHGRVTLCTL